MKKSKVFFSLALIMAFCLAPFANTVKATTTSHELGIVQAREGGYAYQISGKDVFKIVEYVNNGYNFDNAIYCIKAGPGFGGTITNPLEKRTYSISYDMKDLASIPENHKSILPSDEQVTATIDGKEYTYSKYNAVLWILDNMYLPKHPNETERKAMRDALLTSAFKTQLEEDVTPPFTIDQIKLTDDDIEVVQQLAIWHFTNTDEDAYDQGERLAAIQIKAKESSDGYTAFDEHSNRQDDAQTLYTYFINEAVKNASIYGTGDSRKILAPIVLTNTTLKTETNGDNILVGPFNMKKQSDLDYTLTTKVLDQNDAEVSDYKIFYENDNGQKVQLEDGKTLKDIVGKNFYVAVGKDSNVNSITLKLLVSYYESECTFWTVSGSNEDQPVVIVNKKLKTDELKAGLNYNFDLALRKFITAVNKTEVTTRIPEPVVDSNGKITYKHPKDPVLVESGDLVTYTIRIFNEGKVNGYANIIKDDIPAGLEFLPDNETNKKYGWTTTDDGKSIVTKYLDKDDNKTHLIKAFDYPTMKTPDYQDVKVVFKVTEPNSSKNTIINTAQISDDKDENGNEIDDIDSVPDNNILTEDDIDKEYLVLKDFDLALRKFITAVNNTEVTTRIPQISVDDKGKVTYTHPKTPVSVENGDIVVYTIRIFNEGETDGYANLIKDNIPEGLEFIVDNEINQEYRWRLSEDTKTISTDYLSYERDEKNILKAFDYPTMKTPDYKDVKVAFKVIEPNTSKNIIVNTAEIQDDRDKNNNQTEDKDSVPNNGVEGEDDIDKEYVRLKYFDLALRKFITAVNDEKLTGDKSREPVVKIDSEGKIVYEHTKEPVPVATGDLVTYTLRIYNEGSIDGYASEIIDDVPDGLQFVPENETNKKYGWTVSADGKQIKTDYLSRDKNVNNLITAFDNKTMTEPKYKDVQIVFKVIEPNTSSRILINVAEIADDTDKKGNPVEDIDSTPNNNQDGEDDIDIEKVKVVSFDLALRKFITEVNDTEVTTRIPQVQINEDGKITYNHPKDPVLVSNGDLVTYTIRVYNEGTLDGYAESVKDNVPDGLEFLPDNETNKLYGWVVSEDGKTITTDYLSETKAKTNIIKAFQRDVMPSPDYKDVKVVFKVTEKQLPEDRILINTAEIAKDKNEFGTKDIDSTPNNNVEGEDDIDIEKVKVQYFDLSLLKWVSKAIITENGTTTERETGHTGLENPEPIVKVEVDKKKLSKTTVKFEYTIKITNEGQIAGYAKEISDYIPDGLEFVATDNPNWTQADGKVTTRQLENTLLQPGETATVKILLTWKNDANNLGLKINTAEISEDYNDHGSKDIDSTPNNKVEGEDDIDTAPVMLSLKTGQDRIYYVLIGTILITIIGGVVLIKKFVL